MALVSAAIRNQRLDHPEESCDGWDDTRCFIVALRIIHAGVEGGEVAGWWVLIRHLQLAVSMPSPG